MKAWGWQVPAGRLALLLTLSGLAMAPLQAAEQATPVTAASQTQPVTLPGAEQFEIDSRHTGRRYRIFVSVPQKRVASGHPVIYLLDGNALFPTAHTLARSAARVGQRRQADFAAPIIIAIGYPQDGLLDDQARGEDYTPPAPVLASTGDRVSAKQGGADRFLAFIIDELKPLVESRYPIDRTRQTLAGHSYGGLFTLHVLFTQGDAFQRYVAGSPSIWWNQRFVLSERKQLRTATSEQRRLLVTVGSLEQTAPRGVEGEGRAAMLAERRMVDNARELAQSLDADREHGVPTTFRLLEGENHYNAALPMLVRGVEFALSP